MKYRLFAMIGLVVVIAAGYWGARDVFVEHGKSAVQNNGDIVIGVVWPYASRNDLFQEGVDLALDRINAAGGVQGNKLTILKEDDESSVNKGMSIAQKFAGTPGLTAIIGHRSSAVSMPAAAIYEHAGLLMMTPASTTPNLTRQGFKLVFRNIPSDEQIGKEMSDYAASQAYKNVVIYYSDDEYGRGLANAFEDSSVKQGVHIVDRLSAYRDISDLKRIVDKWNTLKADAVFLADVMPHAGKFISELRQAGMKVPIIGGDGLDSDALLQLGDAAEGTVVASVFNPDAADANVREFNSAFTQKYKTAPSKWAAQGYDTVNLLAYAIGKAGSRTPADIAKTLSSMGSWTGVTGPRSFDENGEVHGMPVVKKMVRHGTLEYLN